MSSTIFSAAELAAKHAYLSEVIKQQSGNTAAPTTSSPTPGAIKTSTTPGRLPTPPSSPAERPNLDDNTEVKAVCIGISQKDNGKGKATPSAVEKGNQTPPTSSSSPQPEPKSEAASSSSSLSGGRKLVTVRKISAFDTTNRAGIKLAINGWTVGVTKRGGPSFGKVGGFFEVGHSVVFLEPDTLLPVDHPKFGKLFAQVGNPITYKGQKWFCVGTRRIGNPRFPRWQFVPQGHVFPLQSFPDIEKDFMVKVMLARFGSGDEEKELVDYSAVLGAVKWDPHSDLSAAVKSKSNGSNGVGSKKGNGGNKSKNVGTTPAPIIKIPSWIRKTDIERVQYCPNLFTKAKYKHIVYQETVKIEGASMTCYFVPKQSKYFQKLHKPHPGPELASFSVLETGRFGVCSKFVDLPYSEDCPYWAAAIKNDIASLLEDLHKRGIGSHRGALAIQGEVVGPTISGNHYRLPTNARPSFTIFGIWDIETQNCWGPRSVQDFCATHYLSHVEVLGYVKLKEISSSHDELIARSNARQGEGLVFKSCAGDGRSFKVLSDRWVIERGDEVDAKKAMQSAVVETLPSHSAVFQESESEKVVEPEIQDYQTKGAEKKVRYRDISLNPKDELEAMTQKNVASNVVPASNTVPAHEKGREESEVMSEDKQSEETRVQVEHWLAGIDEAEKESPDVTKKRAFEKDPAVEQEPVVQESPVTEEENVVKEELAVEKPAVEETRAVEEEPALSEVSATIEELAVNNRPVVEKKFAVEEKIAIEEPVVEKHVVEEPSVEEKPTDKNSAELPHNTKFIMTFTNAKDCLNAPVTWLGRPMTNQEAIAEIGRIILAEMAINKDISVSLKELANVVADELKFVNANKNVADQKNAANENAPTSLALTTPTSLNDPDIHSTPTILGNVITPTTHKIPITSTAPHESNPEMESEIVSSAVVGTVQQGVTANPIPPASEHSQQNNDNELVGINWDDYVITNRGGNLVCIPRDEYVPRERPSFYASAEELARREQAKREAREAREARRRYRRCF